MPLSTQTVCPNCNASGYKTLSSRLMGTDPTKSDSPFTILFGLKPQKMRRKHCPSCGHRETTLEITAERLEAVLSRADSLEKTLASLRDAIKECPF